MLCLPVKWLYQWLWYFPKSLTSHIKRMPYRKQHDRCFTAHLLPVHPLYYSQNVMQSSFNDCFPYRSQLGMCGWCVFWLLWVSLLSWSCTWCFWCFLFLWFCGCSFVCHVYHFEVIALQSLDPLFDAGREFRLRPKYSP